MIESHVDDFLRTKLKDEMPVLSMFIGDKTISSLKKVFMLEIEILFPQVMKQFAGNLKNELALENMLLEKLPAFHQISWKMCFTRSCQKNSDSEIIGAMIGFIIGVVQVVITLITS